VSLDNRGIFDGDNPPSTTFIFDDSIFDTLAQQPIPANLITVFVHGDDSITVATHGNTDIIGVNII